MHDSLRERGVSGPLFVSVLIGVTVVAAAYRPVLDVRAVYFDDDQYLLNNAHVRDPGWESAGDFLREVLEPSTVGGYYQPLAMISLMLDCAMGAGPDNFRPIHRTSLVIHLANVGLVALILFRVFGKPVVATLTALVFGLHPMTVETIAWISDRKTHLSAFFALTAMLLYLHFARGGGDLSPPASAAGNAGAHRYRRAFLFAGVCVCHVLSLAAKPSSMPLPLALLVLDVWPLRRFDARRIFEKVPLFVISGAFTVVAYVSQKRTAVVDPPEFGDFQLIPLKLCYSLVLYLRKLVLPVDLSAYYPWPDAIRLTNPVVLWSVVAAIALALSLLLLFLRRRVRAAPCGFVVFVVLLLPAMQIVGFSRVAASDKYVYLPAIGLLMILAHEIIQWANRFAARRGMLAAGTALALLVLLCEFSLTRRQIATWSDSETLYRHTVGHAPRVASLRTMLGAVLAERGETKSAESEYREAIRLRPSYPPAYHRLARLLEETGRTDDAVFVYEALHAARPDLSSPVREIQRLRSLQ